MNKEKKDTPKIKKGKKIAKAFQRKYEKMSKEQFDKWLYR